MKFPLIAFAIAYSSCFCLSAQEIKDSIHLLKEVAVTADRLSEFTAGNKIQIIDSAALSLYQGNNLSELLSQQSQIFIKTYCPGMLSTTSFRGATAEQTAVLWNGFNIQNPMLGQSDMALLPVSFVQDVKLQYGGASALFGSGAIGGTIHLDNSAQYDKGLSVGFGSIFGSFNNFQQEFNFQVSGNKFISSFRIFDISSENNFPFTDIAQYGNPLLKEKNSSIGQLGILQENYYKINNKQEINLRLWYQSTDREIPPSMTEQDTSQRQKDLAIRITSQWQRQYEHSTLAVRAAYFDEQLNFYDPYSSIVSLSRFQTLIAEAEDKISLNRNQTVNIGFNSTGIRASLSDGYSNSPHQEQNSLFCSYKYASSGGKWVLLVNAREEFVDAVLTPFTPSLGLERKLFESLSFKANVSRNYRVPTFNELFYVPGGNPALLPESGWSEEFGLYLHFHKEGFKMEASVTAYNSQTENLITWLPPDPSVKENNWYDANISSVHSRGLECQFSLNLAAGKTQFQLSGMYNFGLSSNPAGEQLIYSPIQSASGNFSIQYKKINFTYNQTYTGYRYETSDNSLWLQGFESGNVKLSKLFIINRVNLKLFVRVNNLWNEAYQIIAWYPMPLRNYQAGISIDFNKPKSKID